MMSETAKATRSAYMKKWRQDHREHLKAYNKKWEREHREERRTTHRTAGMKWYLEHPEKAKKWYRENKDRVKASKAKWRRENPEKAKEKDLQERFGITLAQYNTMLDSQGFACAICREILEDATGKGKTLHVDHCHTTNKVRALLCHNCNAGLGHFRDRWDLLLTAAGYLHQHR